MVVGIANLRRMPDNDGRADVRQAQLLLRQQNPGAAKKLLERLYEDDVGNRFRIRCLRATAAAKDHDFSLARRDIDYIKNLPGKQAVAFRLEATLLVEQGRAEEAEAMMEKVVNKSPEDMLLLARIYELKAEKIETGFEERDRLKAEAKSIRAQRNFVLEYDYAE